jgi:hypothetical protein
MEHRSTGANSMDILHTRRLILRPLIEPDATSPEVFVAKQDMHSDSYIGDFI